MENDVCKCAIYATPCNSVFLNGGKRVRVGEIAFDGE